MLHCDFANLQALEFKCVYGRKGNLYAGNTQNTNSNPGVQSNHGKETNRIYRDTFGLNHRGTWSNGISTNSYVQYARTRNTQLNDGLPNGDSKITKLDNFQAHSEVSVPFEFGVTHPATLGTEWNPQRMRDGTSTNPTLMGGTVPGMGNGTRNLYASAHIFPLFAGDNIELTDSTMLTQVLRYDLHFEAGNNWSSAPNLSQELGGNSTLKMSIARACKAPNLFQTNGDSLLYSQG